MYEMEGPRRGYGLTINPIAREPVLPNRHHPCLKLSTICPADQASGWFVELTPRTLTLHHWWRERFLRLSQPLRNPAQRHSPRFFSPRRAVHSTAPGYPQI
jgi:hypothetical protein